MDFDPSKEKSAFFGRAIVDEQELRDNIKKEKERGLQAWGGSKIKRNEDEDYFEKLVREEREEALKRGGGLEPDLK